MEPDWLEAIEGTLQRIPVGTGLGPVREGERSRARAGLRWLAEQAEGEVLLIIGRTLPPDLEDLVPTANVRDLTGTGDLDEGDDTDRSPVAHDSVDTVLLYRVLETVREPHDLVDHVARVLRPSGRVALVSHLGVNDDPRHLRTLYPSSVLDLVGTRLSISAIEVDGGAVRLLATAGSTDDEVDPARVVGSVEAQLERVLHHTELERERWRAEADRRFARLEEQRRLTAKQVHRAERLKRRLELVREERNEARGTLKKTQKRLERAQERIEDRDRRVEKLEGDRTTLRERLAAEREKRERMRQRRWWRLGELLAAARRNPRKALRLPVDVIRLLRDRGGT